MIQETSKQAYNDLKNRKVLGRRQRQILSAITDHGPMTNLEIALRLDLAINSVTPRVLELRAFGYLERKGVKPDRFGRSAIVWGKVRNQQQYQMEFIR